jgi:hypothetical protein
MEHVISKNATGAVAFELFQIMMSLVFKSVTCELVGYTAPAGQLSWPRGCILYKRNCGLVATLCCQQRSFCCFIFFQHPACKKEVAGSLLEQMANGQIATCLKLGNLGAECGASLSHQVEMVFMTKRHHEEDSCPHHEAKAMVAPKSATIAAWCLLTEMRSAVRLG